jgi:hypothetical protein
MPLRLWGRVVCRLARVATGRCCWDREQVRCYHARHSWVGHSPLRLALHGRIRDTLGKAAKQLRVAGVRLAPRCCITPVRC